MHSINQIIERQNEDGSTTVTVTRDDGEVSTWRSNYADDARNNAIEDVLRK